MTDQLDEIRKKIKANPTDTTLKENFSQLLFNELMDQSEKGENELAEKLLNELIAFTDENIDNSTILLYYGQAILNSMPILFGRATQTDLKGKINHLREIIAKTNNTQLEDILAMVLVNSVYDFSLGRKTPSIHEFSLELMDLALKYPNRIKIQTACAKGMMNATMYFLQEEDKQAARDYFKKLLKIVEANPKEEMVDSRRLLELKQYFG